MPLLFLGAAALLPLPNPDGHLLGLPGLCPLRRLTGFPCPGCGITRSLVCAGHGQWAESARYHPLGPFVLAGLIVWLVWCLWAAPGRKLPPRGVATGAWLGVAALVVIWVARLIGLLPTPSP